MLVVGLPVRLTGKNKRCDNSATCSNLNLLIPQGISQGGYFLSVPVSITIWFVIVVVVVLIRFRYYDGFSYRFWYHSES